MNLIGVSLNKGIREKINDFEYWAADGYPRVLQRLAVPAHQARFCYGTQSILPAAGDAVSDPPGCGGFNCLLHEKSKAHAEQNGRTSEI